MHKSFNMMLKITGTTLAFAGGIVTLFKSIGFFFFAGSMMGNLSYNHHSPHIIKAPIELTVASFVLAMAIIALTLFAFKHHYTKTLFIALILLGGASITIFGFNLLLAELLIIGGGILGVIAVYLQAEK